MIGIGSKVSAVTNVLSACSRAMSRPAETSSRDANAASTWVRKLERVVSENESPNGLTNSLSRSTRDAKNCWRTVGAHVCRTSAETIRVSFVPREIVSIPP